VPSLVTGENVATVACISARTGQRRHPEHQLWHHGQHDRGGRRRRRGQTHRPGDPRVRGPWPAGPEAGLGAAAVLAPLMRSATSARLNAADDEGQPERWARESTVLRLCPHDEPGTPPH